MWDLLADLALTIVDFSTRRMNAVGEKRNARRKRLTAKILSPGGRSVTNRFEKCDSQQNIRTYLLTFLHVSVPL